MIFLLNYKEGSSMDENGNSISTIEIFEGDNEEELENE